LLPLEVSLSNALSTFAIACLSSIPLKNQQNTSFPQKLRALRGLQKGKDNLPILTPLNGFAFGEGSGVSFAFGNSLSTTPNDANGKSVSETKAQGGGFGGGVGYVDATDVGSAYGGGRGGGNVSSLEMNYGLNKGSYTYAVDGGTVNTTFNGVSSGGGFGSGVFGGLFVLDPDTTLEDALVEAAAEAAKNDKGKGKGKDKDKVQAAVQDEAEALVAGFYGSFGNTTGGGGGGFGFTGLYAAGDSATINTATGPAQMTAFGKGNSGVNASASGFGFGGGTTNVGNTTAAGGGFGGGDSDGAAGGQISAGSNTVDGDTSFNATGGGSADGGGAGFIGIGLQPVDVAGVLNSP
jgi:hypothetical protein